MKKTCYPGIKSYEGIAVAGQGCLMSQNPPPVTVNMLKGIYRRIYAACIKGRRINAVSIGAEMLFWRLHCVADDFGTFEAHPADVRSNAIPRREDITSATVGEFLAELSGIGLIELFDADGESYGHIIGFEDFQPGGKNGRKIQKFPRLGTPQKTESKDLDSPNGVSKALDSPKLKSSAAQVQDQVQDEDQVHSPPPTVRFQKNISVLPPGFQKFWKAWPRHHRKASRTKCAQIWKRSNCENISDHIVAMVEASKKSVDWTKDGGAYIPAPMVWLNQGRWDTELEDLKTAPADGDPWGRDEPEVKLSDEAMREILTPRPGDSDYVAP